MKKLILTLFFILVLYSGATAGALKDEQKLILSQESIDILVGTPNSVPDPLNPESQNNAGENTDMTAYLNEWDENENDDRLLWDDAEDGEKDSQVNIDLYESQYLDLISETEEGNSETNKKTFLNFDRKTGNNHVESENKL